MYDFADSQKRNKQVREVHNQHFLMRYSWCTFYPGRRVYGAFGSTPLLSVVSLFPAGSIA